MCGGRALCTPRGGETFWQDFVERVAHQAHLFHSAGNDGAHGAERVQDHIDALAGAFLRKVSVDNRGGLASRRWWVCRGGEQGRDETLLGGRRKGRAAISRCADVNGAQCGSLLRGQQFSGQVGDGLTQKQHYCGSRKQHAGCNLSGHESARRSSSNGMRR